MAKKKVYEEKLRHGTAEVPIGIHKLSYPQGTDAIFYLHWHQEFEILVVTEGQIRFSIEDREYTLHTGDGVFINSNLLHSARTVDGQPCSFFALDFSWQFLHEDIHGRFAGKYLRPVIDGKRLFPEYISRGQEDWQGEFLDTILELRQCPEHDMESYELLLRSRIMAVWDILNRHSIRVKQGGGEGERISERLEPVISYMKENYAYEMTLAELAELIPMSEGQFCRVFKKNMKLSPMQYLMRYRILQSCRLLRDTDKKIGEIANLSGFNNISYYNKVFLQTIGCTPREYRANSDY